MEEIEKIMPAPSFWKWKSPGLPFSLVGKEMIFYNVAFYFFVLMGLNILVAGENMLIFIHLSTFYYSLKTNRNKLALWIVHVTSGCFYTYLDGLREVHERVWKVTSKQSCSGP